MHDPYDLFNFGEENFDLAASLASTTPYLIQSMSHKFWSPPKSLNAWQDWSLFDSTKSEIVHIGSYLSALHPKLFGLHGFFAGDKTRLAVTTTNSLIFKLVRALDSLCVPIYQSKGLSGMMITPHQQFLIRTSTIEQLQNCNDVGALAFVTRSLLDLQ